MATKSSAENSTSDVTLRRVLSLPMLVFYGVGVTIGAGIFALIGEVVRIAGDHAPLAFLLSGVIAGATGISYALLSGAYPRSGGEAVYVNMALGNLFGKIVGYGITATAVISSAVIALAFAGYLGTVVPIPEPVLTVGIVLLLAAIACLGVKESVIFAALITVIELGTLIVIVFFGFPSLLQGEVISKAVALPVEGSSLSLTLSAAVIAFFAFVGFEDIVNMAEETLEPHKTMPWAIVITLLITVTVYVLIATIAVGIPDRTALTESAAPLATLFESISGFSGKPVSVIASIAMVNGILVQIVMASRVIYGMTREGLAPRFIGVLHHRRRTPIRAILLVTIAILVLALAIPLVSLAHLTSLVILSVFTLVNIALYRIGNAPGALPQLRKFRHWGLFAALISFGLLATELLNVISNL